ncbi:MAG: hypothetical protein ACYDAO_01095 [Thermoplasmataceae archaeon]
MISSWNWDVFVLVILALLALSLLVLGVMTAYFGSGKSRTVGIGLIAGAVITSLAIYFLREYTFTGVTIFNDVIEGIIYYGVASVIGVVVGLLIFLGAIMKT